MAPHHARQARNHARTRREGLSSEAAIREAALRRFRLILMTAYVAMLGALPRALDSGAGGELRRPLGVTIVGGLLLSQALTLLTTPVFDACWPLQRTARREDRGRWPEF